MKVEIDSRLYRIVSFIIVTFLIIQVYPQRIGFMDHYTFHSMNKYIRSGLERRWRTSMENISF